MISRKSGVEFSQSLPWDSDGRVTVNLKGGGDLTWLGRPTHDQGSPFICSGLLSHLNKVFNFSIKVLRFLSKGDPQVLRTSGAGIFLRTLFRVPSMHGGQ